MSAHVSLSGMDAAFLALETPSTPMNILGTLVLDPSSASGGYSYERVLRLMEERVRCSGADLLKIALEETSNTLSVRGEGATPHAASASAAAN